ncbi:MAG: cell surface protein SprA [Cyclobacteriaceae bacterium]|nr:cell surface protein SprA [Cyclobacteriaceae bacterium]
MTFVSFLVPYHADAQVQQDSTRKDSVKYRPLFRPSFKPSDRYGDPFSNYGTQSPLFLKDPKTLSLEILPDTGRTFTIYERFGPINYRSPSYMTFDEANQYQNNTILKGYWKSRSQALDGESAVSSRNLLPKLYTSPLLDRIFGGSYVELIPRGFVTLDFGAQWQQIQNPAIPIRQQTNGGFEFDQQINLAVTGKVGEKLKITTNFDNNNSFDFQNQMKVEYTGFKEDILKKLEIGNVSLPLNNSLITGAQNLFGIKGQFQFGKLFATAIATTQRGKQSTITINGSPDGATQGRPFEIVGSNYDENRHFFLAQFFRDNFEKWLGTLPQITSGVNIVRVEVYLLNRQNDTQTLRDVVGLMDLGESDKAYRKDYYVTNVPDGSPADNNNNNLYSQASQLPLQSDGIDEQLQNLFGGEPAGRPFVNGTDYEKITSARKLAPTEYIFNKELGYITLQRKLQNDEAVAVAFEYTYNGRKYKVGELSEDYSNKGEKEVVYLKMLRPRKIAPKDNFGTILPTWDLMMKNIYNLNVTQLQREGFQLRVIYRDDRTGIDNPQLQDGDVARTKQLIEVFGLDRLNPYNDPQPDGNFDYVERITINPETGMIIFPYLEPFNTALRNLFKLEPNANTRQLLTQKYVYDTLYRTTKAEAELVATKNKFYITGSFKAGAGKDIIIQGFNISPGSVKVYAGGTPLREQVDYTVDYTFGKVTILNEGILSSGKTISINYEQQDPFAFQTRSLLGTRFDYKLNEDVNIGSTFLYYNERPLITRNLIGNEPAQNIQYGVDVNLRKNSRLLTKMVDALPFLQTKEQSSFTLNAEFAQLLPGTSNIVDGDGTSFIDDFENTATPYSMLNPVGWKLAHTPADPRFDLSSVAGAKDDVRAGYRRAKLAWYQIDNLFYRESSQFKPNNITSKDLENHYVRPVLPQEIFPYKDPYVGNFYEQILDLAYYPSERGPYNFNPDLNPDGTLKDPINNWAGITTAIRTEVDFDKSNVEYVEFWLMDPFINNPKGVIDDGINEPKSNTTGGKLIFHLGSISEDLMRDGKHAFENGLPTDGNLSAGGVTVNNWGAVTNQQYLNNAFNNDPAARTNQDVGLDGVNNSREEQLFQDFINLVNGSAKPVVLEDPSADDFKYFLGPDHDANNAKILERYKKINGLENNSPVVTSDQAFAQSGSNIPENEDLNQDNTLTELEEYYVFNLDLKPGQIDVGQKYIVDKITPEGYTDVTWYLVRIPIRQFEEKVGAINGFKSIRYARMMLTGFREPVVLRFSNFRAVGNRWRRYTARLSQPQFSEELEPNLDNFSVSVVNVEENGKGNNEKPAYVPPLARDRDITSTIQRRLNEQSVQMCVTNLEDGDGRSIYKNVSFDFFNYGRIKMFLSAHGTGLQDNQLVAFLRLGTDFDQNYYEIQLPLKITPNGNNPNPDVVWPEANQIDLDLNELYALKASRDRETFPLDQLYPLAGPKQVGRHGIRIFGRPDLSQVKLMMIGVVNPRDDTKPLSVCLWADEMRLTDFDRTAGWAVNGVLNAKLADLGNLTTSLRHITYGFGGVQSKISERARGTTTSFDISANILVEKLLPRNTGLKIPMFVSYEKTTINPNFDPANPDMRISAMEKSFVTDAERENYLNLIQDVAIRRSLNFVNVRKTKVKKDSPSRLYDIENFAFTYTFSEATRTNFNLQESTQRNQKGSVAWQYNPKVKALEPFAKVFKSKWLALIKDFNINLIPSTISVRGELDRSFNKIVYRNSNEAETKSTANIQKYFLFNRFYNLHWNLAKSLTLDYAARVNAIIDEPDVDPAGGYSQKLNRYVSAEEYKDSVITNLKKFGRKKNFEQTITANYTVPFDKLPLTDWLGMEYRYNVGYFWKAGPVERSDSLKLGNIIQNTRDQGFNGRIDLTKLYNKVGYLKNINTPKRKPTPTEKAKAKPDTVKQPPNYAAINTFLRLLMSMRSITGTYNITQGTILTGFTGTPDALGMDNTLDAPGWGFILGSQDPDIRFKAAEKGWLTKAPTLTAPFVQNDTRDLGIRTALELSSDFKIQLDVKKTTTSSFQEIFRFDPDPTINDYVELSPSRTGSYRISTISIGTAFENNSSLTSTVFKQFVDNIGIVQQRFSQITGNGYEGKSQDVLIPAFMAAYTGKDANKVGLSPFPSTPLPNWRMDYSGLNKIGALKDAFQSISITHAYSSTYSVTNFTNSLEYSNVTNNIPLSDYNDGIYASVLNSQNQLIPVYVISQVMISEQFAPLFGVSVRTKSKLTARFEYKTKRDLSLNVSNAQITEVNAKDWSLEVGFIKNNMKLPFKSQGRTLTLKNEINFRLNISVTNNQTIQRKIDEVNTITNGNVNIQVRPNVSYTVNSKLNIQVYVDSNVNEPLVSNSFPRSTTRVGAKILFNLSQN